jgi:hypothetical protein
MKKFLLIASLVLAACGKQKGYQKSDNALDAAREYIGACLQGDFAKAAFYMVPGKENEEQLKETEQAYRQKDKEGRQQYRSASINISEVKEISADTTIIHYSNSFDKTPETIGVVRQSDQSWLVNTKASPKTGN